MQRLNKKQGLLSFRIMLSTTLLFMMSCGGNCGGDSGNQEAPKKSEVQDKVLLKLKDAKNGLTILLSEGKDQGGASQRQTLAAAKQLSTTEADKLLERMPDIKSKAGDKSNFAFRESSQPAPTATEKITHQFPPPPSSAKAPEVGGELVVTRFSPEGDVPLAPQLSVSFSRPMVAITSHADSVKEVPVSISPEPAGNWRWIGTKTLLFDPDVRFPMATEYQVTVAKGTKSANGEVLKEDNSFSFTTPSVIMKSQYPTQGTQGLTPVLYIAFDQKIDPQAVIAKLRIDAKGEIYTLRAAKAAEVEAEETVRRLVEAAKKKDNGMRWVVVTPTRELPKDTNIVVSVGVGTPSAEGPRLTTSDQSFGFRTYGPLKIVRSRCGYDCRPGTPFSLEFSNKLEEEGFELASLSVDPVLEKLRADLRGRWMTIRGRTTGQTTYKVTIPGTLKDEFGQTLGEDETRTYVVGDAHPQLTGANVLAIADPKAKTPSFDVHSTNIPSLDVKIYKVGIEDWEEYLVFLQGNPRRPKPAPGKKVFDSSLVPKGDKDRMVTTAIDLASALNKDGKGHAVVVVKPTSWPNDYSPTVKTWVQVTDIGLDGFVDYESLVAWTTDLSTGKALQGADVSISHTPQRTQSDNDGLATIKLGSKYAVEGEHQMIVAKKGSDVAFLPQSTSSWSRSSSLVAAGHHDSLRWFSFDDRQMYKPGEKVRVKGWMRIAEGGKGGGLIGIEGKASVQYRVVGPRGNELGKGTTEVTRLGGFDLSFDLPTTPNLGSAYVELRATGTRVSRVYSQAHQHRFQIQEFRRPEFEVGAVASQGPHIVGKGADVTVDAKYYSGGPLASADVNWTVSSNATSFTPPNQSDYTFGSWVPWWGYSRWDTPEENKPVGPETFSAKTDASGKHVLHMDFLSVKPARPMSVVAEASVMDVNRQAWATKATLLVHPSDLYVGMKRDRYYVAKNEPIKIEGVVVDQEGKAVVGQAASVRAVRLSWEYKRGKYKQVEVDPQTCEVKSTEKSFKCEFETPDGGTYKITASVVDSEGRPNQSELTTWVSGGDRPPEREVTQEQVTLIPNKKEYAGGDTAEILVQAPFYPADALVTIRRSGIERTESFRMESATQTITVPIREGHVPNVYVQVDLVGSAVRVDDNGKKQPSLPRRPAYAKGSLSLAVPPTKRILAIEVSPDKKKLAPGADTSVSVVVRGADGQVVPDAEVTIMVVDESVLALSSYQTPNPISGMYRHRGAGVRDYHQRQWLKLAAPDFFDKDEDPADALEEPMEESEEEGFGGLADGNAMDLPQSVAMAESSLGGARAPRKSARAPAKPKSKKGKADKSEMNERSNSGDSGGVISVRTNFSALAAFSPSVRTDAQGQATLEVKIPDNLTRYRVMAVAAAGKNDFGKGESSITARMPLMVRPSPPRFLNFGDNFELPVVVQNQTDESMTVKVAVRATNASLSEGNGQVVEVPANDRVELRFATAAEMAGTARFQVAASSGSFQDANEFSLPVWTPATTEAFATYGEIDKGAIKQPVRMPPEVVKEFGGLEVTLASTQLQALTDAFLYLLQYPYECAEQTSSRIMGVAALRDVLTAFKSKGMQSEADILKAVKRDIVRLSALQNRDGGFAFWLRGHQSWPYISIYAAHALTLAKAKGFTVPAQMLSSSQNYLQNIERHIPSFYSLHTRRMLIAYALFVRNKMGDKDIARANSLIESAGHTELSMESLGWLMSVLHGDTTTKSKQQLKALHRYLGNKVSETAATANWVDGYSDGAHLVLYSSRRADGVILSSLIEDKPKSELIAKVVRGLLAHRKKGRWGNTQENSFVLLALDAYFQAYEKVTPNFVAQMWLGDGFAGEQEFKGRTTEEHSTEIPMAVLAKSSGDQDLVISKKGPGRLYYRIGMTYAPSDLKLESADHGFAVQRIYEGVDEASDVVRQADGTWKVKAGARVRVRLTMVAENRRYHVALVDPMPAGLEAMNPSLAVTGSIPQDAGSSSSRQGRYWWWNRTWYEHQNMRDERVEAFTPLLWAGVHKYSYVTRATTPGRFIVPPTKAEEMYFPETFGRSASDVVIVE